MNSIEVERSPIGYSLQGAGLSFSPADATTYYFGSFFGHSPVTTAGNTRIPVPKNGTIRLVTVTAHNTGGSPEAQNSTISLRLNNSTDTTISATFDANAFTTAITTYSATVAISVVSGDFIEFKWVTPTLTTNPTGVRLSGTVYVAN